MRWGGIVGDGGRLGEMLGGGIVGDGGRLGEMLGEMLGGGGGEIRAAEINKAISDEKLSAKRVMKEGERCSIFELKETRTNEAKMEELYLSKGGKSDGTRSF